MESSVWRKHLSDPEFVEALNGLIETAENKARLGIDSMSGDFMERAASAMRIQGQIEALKNLRGKIREIINQLSEGQA